MFGLPDYLDHIVRATILGALCLAFIIAAVRFVGLRSFSKMTAFDFVITLATGSLLATATVATSWTAFVQAVAGIGALMAVQVALALRRRASDSAGRWMENEPLMLMRDGVFLEPAMAESRVTRDDVMAKLRGANVLELAEVRAVVLETTGDITVLHGDRLEDALVEGVR
ncbi:MAG: DUF421 domain-containing protein [Rhizobiales bacterium]|nr:DUF421 domain-containing protein [Hyphomicrobiales bacterium]MBA69352.1 DUF421 domain-containing protein [Hyphomicrobiales bacterium]